VSSGWSYRHEYAAWSAHLSGDVQQVALRVGLLFWKSHDFVGLAHCLCSSQCSFVSDKHASGSQDRDEQGERPESASAEALPQPPASAAAARQPRMCAAPGCGAMRGLKRCGGCGTVRYCSEACSRVHWREHRAECRRLQAERAAAAGAPGQQ